MKKGKKNKRAVIIALLCAIILFSGCQGAYVKASADASKKFIKWVDFGVSYEVLDQALKYDLNSYGKNVRLNWIELLAYTAAKNGGKFQSKRSAELDKLVKRLSSGEKLGDITAGMSYYRYFLEAYTAVLGGFVGVYTVTVPSKDDPNVRVMEKRYGLKVFSPIAAGYGFSHCDDFGNSRNYGFKRRHLGHDMMSGVGTPVIAVESGIIEAMGWNRYGGWRIGIRSFDGLRYYYYAHLRKNHPFQSGLKQGDIVNAGDVIGYLGMTGYSTKKNVNNIQTPHLHFGMQLVFDESQKESVSEIWINTYNIVKLLQKSRAKVVKNPDTKEYYRAISAK
ncbi:MAG: M23 family metallopeptidase [Bacillota bacterium]|nr:M23 family metallopeptidase [Bacillota bacterium]